MVEDKLGVIRILGVLHEKELTFTEIRNKTGLSNGTTQRRIKELGSEELIQSRAEIVNGNAVKVYNVPDQNISYHAKMVCEKTGIL